MSLVSVKDPAGPDVANVLGPFPWLRRFFARVLTIGKKVISGVACLLDNDYTRTMAFKVSNTDRNVKTLFAISLVNSDLRWYS